jgi:hypothetical protein
MPRRPLPTYLRNKVALTTAERDADAPGQSGRLGMTPHDRLLRRARSRTVQGALR